MREWGVVEWGVCESGDWGVGSERMGCESGVLKWGMRVESDRVGCESRE